MQPTNPYQPPQEPLPPTPQPVVPPSPPASPQPLPHTMPQPVTPDYGFITNPVKPASKGFSIKLGGSLLSKVAIIGGGVLILLLIFTIAKSIFAGGGAPNIVALTTVAAYQQEVVHIATSTIPQTGIATNTLNSAITAQTSVSSSQQLLLAYMQLNHLKVSPAQLAQKVSTTTDTQLADAAAAGDYDQTYVTTMQAELQAYSQALKQAYAETTGSKGRALLTDTYKQAQLLLQQLSSSTDN